MCKELGYPGAVELTTGSKFGPVTGNFSNNKFSCTGAEKTFDQCEQNDEVINCGPNDAAGVVCKPKLGNTAKVSNDIF